MATVIGIDESKDAARLRSLDDAIVEVRQLLWELQQKRDRVALRMETASKLRPTKMRRQRARA